MGLPAPATDDLPGSSVHVIAGLDPAHGGPTYAVPRLCQALADAGAATTLLALGDPAATPSLGAPAGLIRWFGQDLGKAPLLRSARLSSGLARALAQVGRSAEVIHNHGLWLAPNLDTARRARRLGKPLITTVHGMLSPAALRTSRWRKRLVWALAQRRALAGSVLHATGETEYADIRAAGLRNPVAVIPIGIDLPGRPVVRPSGPGPRTVVSLGRIHPHKGFDRLITAWSRVGPQRPDWRLRIIGPDTEGYAAELHRLIDRLGLDGVSIEPAIGGAEKFATLGGADLFVLASLSENFGLTVAEALAAGAPAITTRGAPWQGLETHGCGWWIDHGPEPLAAALEQAMAMPRQELDAMGARGRAWVEQAFGWAGVARSMLAVYAWAAGRAGCPDVVRPD